MLKFNDSRWTEMKGGYRINYDPRPALRKLWVVQCYDAALIEIAEMAIARIATAEDQTLIQALFEMIAISKKQYAFARFASLSESARKEALDELGWA